MTRHRRGMAACLLAALAWGAAGAAGRAGESVNWRGPDWRAASRQAQAEGKLVFVFVRTNTCSWCDFFEKNYNRDPGFAAWNNALFVNLRVNAATAEGNEFLQQFGLSEGGVPRFYVLDPSGRALARKVGTETTVPFQALAMFYNAPAGPMPFDRGRVIELAKRLREFKDGARGEKAAIYAGMEALAWQWAGSVRNAQAAFGAPWAAHLDNADIRKWYVYFWGGMLRENLDAALGVAETGFREHREPEFARYAAILYSWRGDYRRAVEYGDAYLKAVPDDHGFRQALDQWRRR